jgi:hypothetical protein
MKAILDWSKDFGGTQGVQRMEIFELDLCKQVHGVNFCDKCGNYYERIGRVAIGNLIHNLE